MNDLFHGIELIYAYIYDLFILSKVNWTDHAHKLELTLNKLKENGNKCNIERSFFGKSKWNI